MKKQWKITGIRILICFLLGLVLGIVIANFSPKQPSKKLSASLRAAYDKAIPELDRVLLSGDSKKAGEYITSLHAHPRVQNALGAYLGRAIYTRYGRTEVVRCFEGVTEESNLGCLIGFINASLAQGESGYTPMYSACLALSVEYRKTLCVHMLGHALTATLGYELSNLQDALGRCAQFPDPTQGANKPISMDLCKSGVFMEYFLLQSGLDGTGIHGSLKKEHAIVYDPNKPYDFCPNVSDANYCYGQLVHWWIRDLQMPKKKVATLCLAVKNERGRENCVSSLGQYIYNDISHELLPMVQKNVNNSGACKDEKEYYTRYNCYQSRLIWPLSSKIFSRVDAYCKELNLGDLYSECWDASARKLSQFDYY